MPRAANTRFAVAVKRRAQRYLHRPAGYWQSPVRSMLIAAGTDRLPAVSTA